MKRRRKRLVRIIAALAVLALIFIYKGMFNGKGLYFTTGFGKHEILQAGSQKAYDYEASILFADVRKLFSPCGRCSVITFLDCCHHLICFTRISS